MNFACRGARAVAVAIGALAVAAAAPATDWQPLFNGRDLSGWRGYKQPGPPTRWIVRDGVIELGSAGERGDLVTVEQFGDFELELEWKIAAGGNSGIFYRVAELPAAAHTFSTGPEMQILDDAGHADGKLPSHRAGCLYDLVACSAAAAKPVGEWNRVRIKLKDGRIEHWLNGQLVVAASYGDDAWRALVAGSKFAAMPGFGMTARGHIALQDHGDQVWFRNIRIRTLEKGLAPGGR